MKKNDEILSSSILATPILNPQYTEEKIFREDAMSGWEKKELKDEKIKELNAHFTEEKNFRKESTLRI